MKRIYIQGLFGLDYCSFWFEIIGYCWGWLCPKTTIRIRLHMSSLAEAFQGFKLLVIWPKWARVSSFFRPIIDLEEESPQSPSRMLSRRMKSNATTLGFKRSKRSLFRWAQLGFVKTIRLCWSSAKSTKSIYFLSTTRAGMCSAWLRTRKSPWVTTPSITESTRTNWCQWWWRCGV